METEGGPDGAEGGEPGSQHSGWEVTGTRQEGKLTAACSCQQDSQCGQSSVCAQRVCSKAGDLQLLRQSGGMENDTVKCNQT